MTFTEREMRNEVLFEDKVGDTFLVWYVVEYLENWARHRSDIMFWNKHVCLWRMNETVKLVESVNYHLSLSYSSQTASEVSGFSSEAVVLRVWGTVCYCSLMYGHSKRDTCTTQITPHFGAIPNTSWQSPLRPIQITSPHLSPP